MSSIGTVASGFVWGYVMDRVGGRAVGLIGAMGAVVAHDVPDYTLVAGNPARVVKRLEKR